MKPKIQNNVRGFTAITSQEHTPEEEKQIEEDVAKRAESTSEINLNLLFQSFFNRYKQSTDLRAGYWFRKK